MTWNQAAIQRLTEQGYGPNDPEWRAAIRELAEPNPEPDWDQMRTDLGIRRDPIQEILGEPNLPHPRFDFGDIGDPNIFDRILMDWMRDSFAALYRARLLDHPAVAQAVTKGLDLETSRDESKKERDRRRMKAHLVEQRRRQRSKNGRAIKL